VKRYVIFAGACFVALLVSQEMALSLPIAGVGPDIAIIVLAAFAVGERPRTGAMAGFALGLVRDLLITTPAGLSALAYSVTAYVVALIGVTRSAWMVVALVAGATLSSQVMYGVGAVLLGPQVDPSPLPRMILVTTAYNALISPLLMPVLRRVIQTEVSQSSEERVRSLT
jgi:rod shape-determining protein MreD